MLADALPHLPSLFSPLRLREGADAIARAAELAPVRGAGTLCWVGSHARMEAAVVLEPEQPLAAARAALLAGLVALIDALVALGPPETAVTFRWPATLLVNGGRVGGAQLQVPPGAAEAAVPDWLVLGVEARLAFSPRHEPGWDPSRTSLAEEGFAGIDAAALTAAWARHLMATLADWRHDGFPRLAERVLARLEAAPGLPPGRRGIDPADGALILGDQRLPLSEAKDPCRQPFR